LKIDRLPRRRSLAPAAIRGRRDRRPAARSVRRPRPFAVAIPGHAVVPFVCFPEVGIALFLTDLFILAISVVCHAFMKTVPVPILLPPLLVAVRGGPGRSAR
jgi:hypothetical protein